MKLARPHISIKIRLEVIARQLMESKQLYDVLTVMVLTMKESERLAYLLKCKFGDEPVALDHDPPLMLREIVDAEKGIYKPDACDPKYLVYRTAAEHKMKTFVRGDGAQYSDAAKRRRMIRSQRQDRPKPNRWPPKGTRPLQWKPR